VIIVIMKTVTKQSKTVNIDQVYDVKGTGGNPWDSGDGKDCGTVMWRGLVGIPTVPGRT
jgi:hypothetical protein